MMFIFIASIVLSVTALGGLMLIREHVRVQNQKLAMMEKSLVQVEDILINNWMEKVNKVETYRHTSKKFDGSLN